MSEPTIYGYTDASDCLVYQTTRDLDLADVQAMPAPASTATTKITGIPSNLLEKGKQSGAHVKTSGDGTDPSHWAMAVDLDAYKTWRCKLIDRKTRSLFDAGFVHDSKTFSLSANAQASYNAAYANRANLTYPITWSTMDDADEISIADTTEMASFCEAAFAAVQSLRDGGTTLKASVRSAADQAAVDAVTDSR